LKQAVCRWVPTRLLSVFHDADDDREKRVLVGLTDS
jgi:hypothetical protein